MQSEGSMIRIGYQGFPCRYRNNREVCKCRGSKVLLDRHEPMIAHAKKG